MDIFNFFIAFSACSITEYFSSVLIPEVGSSNKTIDGFPNIAIKISKIFLAPELITLLFYF